MAYKLDDLSVTATAADVGDDDDFVPNFVRSQSKNLGRPLAQVIQNSAPESKRRQPRSRTQSSRLASREVLSPTLSSVSTPVDDFHCRQAIQNFRHKIAGEEALKHRKDNCWEWYQQYLETLKSGAWELVILPVVDGLSPDIPEDDPRSVLIFYRILAKVAEYFDQRKALTLVQMVQELKREKLIKQNCEMNAAIQMVFQMTGWLTTLWDPVLDTSTTHLSLRNTRRGARRPIALHCPTVTQRQLEIGESHTPFYRLLTRFGTLLPEPKIIFPDASRGDLEAGPETIDVSYLAFHHLKHDLKVRLEWTSTMNQHLELDSGSGVLYIYRFPSICRLMYHDRTGTIASRVYREYSEVFEKEASPRVRNMLEETEIEDFYAEILLSYDLIFGRHRRSRMLARKKLSDEAEIRHAEGLDDPLLEILCTKPTSSSQVSTIHRELDAENWEDYIELEKFPFLGERLINLQRRSMSRKTHSWRQLWNDNRNIGNWFIIWSVMFFGVCTIGLGITQLIFQIFQIWPPR